MNGADLKKVCHMFAKLFFILFIIIIVLPLILDCFVRPLREGGIPGNNSIIVFKEYLERQELTGRFISIVRKILIFM